MVSESDNNAAGTHLPLSAPAAAVSGREVLFGALRSYGGPDVAVVVVEVASLLAACLLHAMYMRADEAAEEAEELGAAQHRDVSEPLITARQNEVATSGRRGGTAPLSSRPGSQRV
ncbi:hypothetical protein HYH02_005419 [Chlamydomonas schloesseri]|uniref:Uncharacterized protein n=1 Tax=Chlamydomonas schloesseri TaxID=2026947 RepID=A0A835WKI0_9CHLO|nr:hypothetical protein HYH02_005419 [Chlamydomonas schloesseri]|eukprot:KAG2449262.1 hypothetical protein HYH02_005419 [Chlamydomonas schloesseri]